MSEETPELKKLREQSEAALRTLGHFAATDVFPRINRIEASVERGIQAGAKRHWWKRWGK